ncbi:hypothetical protein [Actinoplanes ianthinogenes]|uniref:hypothetical protein n=1 Tax=Actinoplanes ianthinogenes TaxID=122358 RepID=UPI0016702380|nr:hypothetical protein [Actinoplanes ianthinogenes]
MTRLLWVVPLAALLLWGAVSPPSQWRVLAGWAYRDPEANEPSDTAYLLTRLGNIVALVFLVCASFGTFGGTDSPPRADSSTATATATADVQTRADLIVDFGADRARVAVVPQASAAPSPGTTAAMEVYRRREVNPAFPPSYLGRALPSGGRNWLLLGVRGDAPPALVTVRETAGQVIVGVYGPGTAAPGGATIYLVPARLGAPLAGRPVVDEATGRPVP